LSGFIYLWYDTHHRMFYIGSHWGPEDDNYVCSSPWMLRAYKKRKHHFRKKILERVHTTREDLLKRENYWLSMIKESEMKPNTDSPRYYNLLKKTWNYWHTKPDTSLTVGQKISVAKKGKKTGPRDPAVGKAISEAKRKKFEERRARGLPCYDINVWENNPNMARTQTPEINARRSESLKRTYREGKR
jgi:hypothetical protein